MDEKSTDFRRELAKQIFEVLKGIFDARNQRRLKIFAKEIAPLMDRLRASHADFLEITSKLDIIISRIVWLFEENRNDVNGKIDSAIRETIALNEVREKRRIERREIFEEAIWRHGQLQEGHEFKELVLTTQEAETLSLFYALLSKYFSSDRAEYFHEIPSLIWEVDHKLRLLRMGKSDRGELLLYLKNTQKNVVTYEKQLESRFGEIARSFAGLKQLE